MATSPTTPTVSDAGISSFRISVVRFSEASSQQTHRLDPEMATGALDNDGLPERFQVLVYPDHRNWEWRDKAPDPSARERAYETIEQLANFDPVAYGAKPAGQYEMFSFSHFTDGAQEIFIQRSIELHDRRIKRLERAPHPAAFVEVRQTVSRAGAPFSPDSTARRMASVVPSRRPAQSARPVGASTSRRTHAAATDC